METGVTASPRTFSTSTSRLSLRVMPTTRGLRTTQELKQYLNLYMKRSPLDFLLHRLELQTVQRVRRYVQPGTTLGRIATRAYSFIKR